MTLTARQNKVKNAKKVAEESEDKFIDTPTTDDFLTFNRFTNPIAEIISKEFDKRRQLTIGVYGEWGSGKTSFLKMVAKHLREEKHIYPVWFDAWKYDKEDNLWSALLQSILNQVSEHGNWYRRVWVKIRIWTYSISLSEGMWEITKKLLSLFFRLLVISISLYIALGLGGKEFGAFFNNLLSHQSIIPTDVASNVVKAIIAFAAIVALDPFKLIGLIKDKIGVDFSKFERRQSYRDHIAFLDDFSREFHKIIQLLMPDKPLVVIIDDLDRCLPEKALIVLEAIKAFLDIPGCVFLLGLDREMMEKTVALKYKELSIIDSSNKSDEQFTSIYKKKIFHEDYMEKIIQLSIVVPRLPESQISDFINRLKVTTQGGCIPARNLLK
jgi:KAP family P-loop domain